MAPRTHGRRRLHPSDRSVRGHRGGIGRLGWLIVHHWRPVEAWTRRIYHVDAATLSCRQLVAYIDELPDGWLNAGWGTPEELAAQTVELLDAVRLQTAALTGDKKIARMKPYRIPRPSTGPKQNRWVDFIKRLAHKVGG